MSRKISSEWAPGSGSVETTRAGVRDKVIGLTDDADVAAFRMMQRHRNPQMFYLRVGENLIDFVDGSGRHALLFEEVKPLR